MKRVTISLLLIAISSYSYAAYQIGFTGLYIQSSGSNGANDFLSSANLGTSSQLNHVPFDYDLGYGVNLGYLFHNAKNSLNLRYFHFNNQGQASAIASSGGIIGADILNITNQAQYLLNQGDLTVGHYFNLGTKLRLHPNTGLRWVSLKHNFDGNFNQRNQNPILPNGHVNFSESSTFNGIGLLAGMETYYPLIAGLRLANHFDTSLLVGNVTPKANAKTINFIDPINTVLITGFFNADATRQVLPIIDLKLGFDYTYLFQQNSAINLEIGYLISNYFNAVDRLSVSGNGVIEGRTTSSLFINGLFATFTFKVLDDEK